MEERRSWSINLGLGVLFLAAALQGFAQTPSRPAANVTCAKTVVFREHDVVARTTSSETPTFFFVSGFAVDADGAYKAYHPRNRSALDSLDHAGHPGNWWALVTDNDETNGHPMLQGKSDPAPGYYISMTSLVDPGNPNRRDPRKYVNSAEIPYIALTPRGLKHARLGDFATVVNLRNGRVSGAIVADVTDPGTRAPADAGVPLGEGSIALARALGIDSNPRHGGIEHRHFIYLVYPGSGNGAPRSLPEIEQNSQRLFETWGGLNKLNDCVADGAKGRR